jgi:hypothetical protein
VENFVYIPIDYYYVLKFELRFDEFSVQEVIAISNTGGMK